ncbi:FecR family protein [Maribellus maritimus]|uniref:FecR family protein n=1 Tax=Maribellus maritimus TaxID=2870838 RepID=UPI001EEC559E|nr:FecR family protein [Maribellus maritimus]MCG6187852.1 DUF4974 domain-containing protein [Maribellus maritimus]
MDEEKNIGKHIVEHLQDNSDAEITDPVLQTWAETSAENKQDLFEYTRIWDGVSELAQRNKFSSSKAWEKVDSSIKKRSIISERYKISLLSAAAAFFLILFGFSFYFYWVSGNTEEPLQLVTELGSRSEATLPDGTIVKLNAGSELAYRYDRHKKIRSVQFTGEGYFEVEKNRKPFVVQLQNGLTLKVLGTKFNLSAYPDDAIIKTTLTEGKVELQDSKGEKLILAPGEIASFSKKTGELSYLEEAPSRNLSWMEKRLYMDNMSMAEVCRILERWYDVEIKFAEKEMAERIHYTGTLWEKTIYDVFEALDGISEIEYKIEGRNIVVSEKK